MGTFSTAYIQTGSMKIVKKIISKYYKIINEEMGNTEQDWRFFQNGSDTIIISVDYGDYAKRS